jgi:hypothetical protein
MTVDRHQLKFPGLEEWLPEAAAAEFVGLDAKSLRCLRSGHWKGLVPFTEVDGEYLYPRSYLEGYLVRKAKRKAGTNPAYYQLLKEF